jgi:hypothetical protein
MSEINLLETTDAMVWAEEFVRIKIKQGWTWTDIDEGLMVGWFANAMAAQEMACRKTPDPRVKELVESLEQLARLGNGGRYGNSEGNSIAQQAIAKWREG